MDDASSFAMSLSVKSAANMCGGQAIIRRIQTPSSRWKNPSHSKIPTTERKAKSAVARENIVTETDVDSVLPLSPGNLQVINDASATETYDNVCEEETIASFDDLIRHALANIDENSMNGTENGSDTYNFHGHDSLDVPASDIKQLSSMDYTVLGTISPLNDSNCLSSKLKEEMSFVLGHQSDLVSSGDVGLKRCLSPPYEPCPILPFNKMSSAKRVSGHQNRSLLPLSTGGREQKLREITNHMGILCEGCNTCLLDLKQQALRLTDLQSHEELRTLGIDAIERLKDKLQVPENGYRYSRSGYCEVCDTHVIQLKQEALSMVQSIQTVHSEPRIASTASIPNLSGSVNLPPPTPRKIITANAPHIRYRMSKINGTTHGNFLSKSAPIAPQAPAYHEQNVLPRGTQKRQVLLRSGSQDKTVYHKPGEMYPQNGLDSPGVGHYGRPVYYPLSGSHLINTPYMQQQPLSTQVYHQPQQQHQQQHQQQLQQYLQQQQFYQQHQQQQMYQYHPHQYHYLQHSHSAPGSPSRIQSPPPQIVLSQPPRIQSPSLQAQPPSTHFSRIASPPPSVPPVCRVTALSQTLHTSVSSPAASFFARAAQKLGKKKKRHHQPEPVLPSFPTKFSEVLKLSCPPCPPCLLRNFGRIQPPGMGKVKVMLRIVANNHHGDQSSSFLNIDTWNKQITVYDPAASGYATSAAHRKAAMAPKMFAFDGMFSPDDSLTEVCSGSLTEIIQGVVAGADGCVFTYGYSKLGKTYTMIGEDVSSQTLGLIPCAIAWLFKVISEQKDETGARFSVRVSAVEVSGKQEVLKDLLANVAQGTEAGIGTAPGVYLREDPISGTQLENQSELRAPTAEKAAFYLDAALNARTKLEESRSSHLLFTLHVYQYRIEKENRAGLPGVAGGRSRLHLIDLGSASKSKDPDNVALSLSALGNVIMAHLNGQRHVPHRDSKVAQLLRDSLGNITCHTCMLVHVSQEIPHYNESLQVIQLAARIHRMRRRKVRGQFSGTSSDDSSTSDGSYIQRRPYRGFRMGTLHEGSSLSDPDYTSSSESCNTVIYLGNNGQSLSDRELTDHEGQPRAVPRTNPRLPRRASGSRSSGDEGSNSDSGRSLYRSQDSITRLKPSASSSPVRDVSVTGPQHGTLIKSMASTVPIKEIQYLDVNLPVSVSPPSVSFGLPQKVNILTKTIPGKQDGLSSNQCYASVNIIEKAPGNAIKTKRTTSPPGGKDEQWIDGPGAAIYQKRQNSGEQWIDGPSAFIVKQEQKHDKSKIKMSCEEMWVDGPPEMLAENQIDENQNRSPKIVMHTSLKKANVRTLPSSPKQQSPINSPALQRSENVATQLVRQLSEIKERPEKVISIDSEALNLAGPDNSRPNSMLTNAGDDEDLRNNDFKVKPFVKDWVERHGVADSEKSFMIENSETIISTPESASGSDRRTKLQDCRTKNFTPFLSTPKQSFHHYPKNSPSMTRKSRPPTAKLSKPNIPTTSSTSKRVTDWLKSVESNEEEETIYIETKHSLMESDISTDKLHTASENMDACEDISSCSSVYPNTTLNDSKTNDNTAIDVSLNKTCDPSNDCLIADTSFDSSADTTNSAQNRNSIYEFQMDEQLENGLEIMSKKGDGDDDDDDTFSNASCAKDFDMDTNEQVCEKNTEMKKSETIQSIQTLVGDHVYSDMIHDDSKCDDGCKINVKPNKRLDLDHKSHLLSRKPDGASNPNLIGETFSENTTINALCIEHPIVNVKSSQASDSSKRGPERPSCRQGFGDGTADEQYKLEEIELELPQKPCSKCGYSQENSKPIAKMCKDCQKMVALSIKNSHSSVTRKEKSKYGVSLPSSTSASPPNSALGKSSKSKNMQSGHSKLPVFSKNLQVSSKDLKSSHKNDCKKSGFLSRTHRSQDSDSGNDGGIAPIEKTLLSPYATVTKPRTVSHSSSGHGSDNSSTMSADMISKQGSSSLSDKQQGGTSSGYESMLKDSDGSGSSTIYEDSAEESSGDKQKGVKKKCLPSTHRSKSVPGRSLESPDSSSRKSSPSSKNSSLSPTSKVWQEKHSRQKDERPMEIQEYDAEDVSRMTRHRVDEEVLRKNYDKIKEILKTGHEEQEMPHRKDTYIVDHNHWSFDCKFLMCFSCRSRKTDV